MKRYSKVTNTEACKRLIYLKILLVFTVPGYKDHNFHDWKVIPLYLIKNCLDKNFKFHSNAHIKKLLIKGFPIFYQQIFQKWNKYLSAPVSVTSEVLYLTN